MKGRKERLRPRLTTTLPTPEDKHTPRSTLSRNKSTTYTGKEIISNTSASRMVVSPEEFSEEDSLNPKDYLLKDKPSRP